MKADLFGTMWSVAPVSATIKAEGRVRGVMEAGIPYLAGFANRCLRMGGN